MVVVDPSLAGFERLLKYTTVCPFTSVKVVLCDGFNASSGALQLEGEWCALAACAPQTTSASPNPIARATEPRPVCRKVITIPPWKGNLTDQSIDALSSTALYATRLYHQSPSACQGTQHLRRAAAVKSRDEIGQSLAEHPRLHC